MYETVTFSQMERANMVRSSVIGYEFAVPVKYRKQVTFKWKTIFELKDSDYDRINRFFKDEKENSQKKASR